MESSLYVLLIERQETPFYVWSLLLPILQLHIIMYLLGVDCLKYNQA